MSFAWGAAALRRSQRFCPFLGLLNRRADQAPPPDPDPSPRQKFGAVPAPDSTAGTCHLNLRGSQGFCVVFFLDLFLFSFLVFVLRGFFFCFFFLLVCLLGWLVVFN